MTARETAIVKAILRVLHDADGGQRDAILLHAEVNLMAQCPRGEFDAALGICDARGWLTGVQSRHNKNRVLWSLNDAGEAALLEL